MFPDWFGSALIHFAMVMIMLRAVVCAMAGWGLLERTQWGRIMAIIASVICMLKIPFGTALGVAIAGDSARLQELDSVRQSVRQLLAASS